jgi:hypothetical protein
MKERRNISQQLIEENGSIERENQQLHRIPGTTKVILKFT